MNISTKIKKSNILTLPKIAFSVFFLLLMLGSIIRAESIISILIHDWLDVIITVFVIVYMLKSAFKKTTFPEKYSLTTFVLLLFSFYIIYIDIRLLFSIIYLDLEEFNNTYLGVWIGSFWGLPILLISLLIDSMISKNSESNN